MTWTKIGFTSFEKNKSNWFVLLASRGSLEESLIQQVVARMKFVFLIEDSQNQKCSDSNILLYTYDTLCIFFEITCLLEKGFAFLFGFIANTPDKMKRISELYTFLGREQVLSVRILSDADQGRRPLRFQPIHLATADGRRPAAWRVSTELD